MLLISMYRKIIKILFYINNTFFLVFKFFSWSYETIARNNFVFYSTFRLTVTSERGHLAPRSRCTNVLQTL